jgi:hypothetical protein
MVEDLDPCSVAAPWRAAPIRILQLFALVRRMDSTS